MQMLNEYHWAQDKIDEVVTSKKHREEKACERRLRQMQAKREKLLKRYPIKALDTAIDAEKERME